MTEALITALAYWGLILLYRLLANSMADQPIIAGPVVGLLLGDIETGVLIGASLQVIYLGVVNVGGAQSTDTLFATCTATALAIMTGISQEAAITLSIPLGYIGLVMLQVVRIFFAVCIPLLDKVALEGNIRKYDALFVGHIVVGYGLIALTVFVALAAGAGATQAFIDALPPFIMKGMQVAAGLLPAIGLAILLNMMWDNKKLIYFLLGFALVAYLAVPTLGMAIIGLFLMLVDFFRSQEIRNLESKLLKAQGTGSGVDSDTEDFFDV